MSGRCSDGRLCRWSRCTGAEELYIVQVRGTRASSCAAVTNPSYNVDANDRSGVLREQAVPKNTCNLAGLAEIVVACVF